MYLVMAALDPAIHVFLVATSVNTSMPGTRPGITVGVLSGRARRFSQQRRRDFQIIDDTLPAPWRRHHGGHHWSVISPAKAQAQCASRSEGSFDLLGIAHEKHKLRS
jgi:hypothetical protein